MVNYEISFTLPRKKMVVLGCDCGKKGEARSVPQVSSLETNRCHQDVDGESEL